MLQTNYAYDFRRGSAGKYAKPSGTELQNQQRTDPPNDIDREQITIARSSDQTTASQEQTFLSQALQTGSIRPHLNRQQFYSKEEAEKRDLVRKTRLNMVAGYLSSQQPRSEEDDRSETICKRSRHVS